MQISVPGSSVSQSQVMASTRVAEASTAQVASSPPAGAGRPDPWHDPRPFNPLQSPATLLSTTPDGKMTVGGVRWGFDEKGPDYRKDWEPRFSNTTIDPSAVRDVYFVVEPFNGVGHAFLVFEFDPAHPVVNARGESENRLAVSVEARVKQGEVWTPVQGLKKKFALIYQVSSFSDQVQKRSHGAGHSMELRRLDLDDTQKQALMRNALQESFKDRQGEYYHTTRNSCYSRAEDMLNSVLGPSQSLPKWLPLPVHVARPSAFLPPLAGAALRRKGLLADSVDTAIQADAKVFPDKQIKPGRLTEITRRLSESPVFAPLMRVAGFVGGAAALASTGLVGAVVGGLAARYVAGWAADHLYTSSHLDYVSPDPWLKTPTPVQTPGAIASAVPVTGAPLPYPLVTPPEAEQALIAGIPAPPAARP